MTLEDSVLGVVGAANGDGISSGRRALLGSSVVRSGVGWRVLVGPLVGGSVESRVGSKEGSIVVGLWEGLRVDRSNVGWRVGKRVGAAVGRGVVGLEVVGSSAEP